MIYLSWAIAFSSALAAACFLVITDHNYFAIAVLFIAASMDVRSSRSGVDNDPVKSQD